MRTLLLMGVVFILAWSVYSASYWLTRLYYWIGRRQENRRRQLESLHWKQEFYKN